MNKEVLDAADSVEMFDPALKRAFPPRAAPLDADKAIALRTTLLKEQEEMGTALARAEQAVAAYRQQITTNQGALAALNHILGPAA